jgi:hypothetical protein
MIALESGRLINQLKSAPLLLSSPLSERRSIPHSLQQRLSGVRQDILPKMDSVLLLMGKGNPSAPIDQAGTKEVCVKRNIKYKEVMAESKEEVLKAVAEHKEKVSAMIIGNQALVIDITKDIIAGQAKPRSSPIHPNR